jgi:hypothetical protein
MRKNWFMEFIGTIISAALVASAFFGALGLLIMAFKFFVRMVEGI